MRQQRVTAQDLKGRHCISYFRFSSSPQERGSTIDRQQETLDRVLSAFDLVLDDSLIDRALSASKGHHRSRGQLGDLLKAVDDGDIAPGTVLVFEAWDRLYRQGILDVFPDLKKMIRAGMILVAGRDLCIYCEAGINGELSHKLVAEINAARDYAIRLGEMAEGAHAARRRKIVEYAANPQAPVPNLNGLVPGWIIRTKGKADYRLHPVHGQTIRRIFQLCAAGASCGEIAATLNREGVPPLPGMDNWRAPRIGSILRDRHCLGYYTPTRLTGGKRVPIGPEILVFPPAISAAEWVAAGEVLDAKKCFRGARGDAVPNLFTRKTRCKSCGASLRVDTGGGIRRGKRKRDFICSSFVERSGCQDNTRYDLHHYEWPLLSAVMELTALIPDTPSTDHAATLAAQAEIKVEIEQRQGAVAGLLPLISTSPTLAQTVAGLSVEIDNLTRKLSDITIKQDASVSTVSRSQEMWAFLKALIRPAVHGDVAARDRLRGLLAKMDFEIVGDDRVGGMLVSSGAHERHILPAQ